MSEITIHNPARRQVAVNTPATRSIVIGRPTSGGGGGCSCDHTIENSDSINKLIVTLGTGESAQRYAIAREVLEAPSTPTLTAGGTFTRSKSVEITSTSGASIYYTTDGSTPTAASTPYTGAFTLSQDTSADSKSYTVKAIAIKNGEESEVGEATYVIKRQVDAPIIAVDNTNKYAASHVVTITQASADTIYYTTDGSTPTTSSSTITSGGTITLSSVGTHTVKALAVKANWVNSSVAEKSGIVVGAKKCYIGRGGETLSALTGLTGVEADNLNGERTVTLASSGYIWFVVPSSATISSITSGPLSVPFALKANSVSGYNCYRTDLEITAGTYTYNIA